MDKTVIIGGGAAGFFAAISIAEHRPGGDIIILERGRAVLEKVRISGGGRCNVTHACFDPGELVQFYPRGSRELLGPFHKFACGDTMGWFADRGVALKIEEDGRVFPKSNSSQTIIDCLWREAKQRGVKVVTGARVTDVSPPALRRPNWRIKVGEEWLESDRLVVTTGSNPAVWKLLGELGHRIVDPVPSLFAVNIADRALRALAGISLPWVHLEVEGGKLQADGPLLITHKGLSGPAVLRLSAWGARELHPLSYAFDLRVNWLARRAKEVGEEISANRESRSRQQIGSRSPVELPQRLWQMLVASAGIAADLQWAQLSNAALADLVAGLTGSVYRVIGKATNKDEFTTAGGVALDEIDFRSFRSKRYDSLYLAGEVLDIDAITGGFNFQAAWTGGWLIGRDLE
ncbi:hypothetical protein CLV84_2282 [Neolewinella xylanilytica]|uniref:Flavoprotein n=1 Tax=Neolewinella xylanilytica TaxID=1514080 RepID=A0A2S6I2H9_9BACT|nr:aminoacetone oxidase family FAD-binding enzyme [Neolewinella xylanilytica]PPK85386.1 hypothetical protein CLV84_2282 [Neolewinella xylanilytica]